LALVVVAVLSAVGGHVAEAKAKSCADEVIADWYDDGRVGKLYPLECYRQAIAKLPPDVLDYSNAKEEIGRALAFAKQGKPDPGGQDPTPPTTAGTRTTATATTSTTTTTKTGTTKTTTTRTATSDTETTDTSTTDTSGPSSVPVPLLVLGGLAVLLLAAGSAGYLRRRMSGGDGGDGTPPAAT
jgi:cobalamin biosynthesis Mg chelatase CobN